MSKERFAPGIPNGWFAVAWSSDVTAGEVERIRYFDEELVLFRTRQGKARVLSAYCPHLGAHFGYGGEVEGGTIRCPFHYWRFDGSTGACVEVPYAKRIPARAEIRTYPTCEKNGIIFMWHHPDGEEPKWEIPEVPGWDEEGWLDTVYHTALVRSHPQEMAENVVDSPHFHYVHGTPDIPEKTFTFFPRVK